LHDELVVYLFIFQKIHHHHHHRYIKCPEFLFIYLFIFIFLLYKDSNHTETYCTVPSIFLFFGDPYKLDLTIWYARVIGRRKRKLKFLKKTARLSPHLELLSELL